jgi:hypothetical protein
VDGVTAREIQWAEQAAETAGAPTGNTMADTKASSRRNGYAAAPLFAVTLAGTGRNSDGAIQLPAFANVHALTGDTHFD